MAHRCRQNVNVGEVHGKKQGSMISVQLLWPARSNAPIAGRKHQKNVCSRLKTAPAQVRAMRSKGEAIQGLDYIRKRGFRWSHRLPQLGLPAAVGTAEEEGGHCK